MGRSGWIRHWQVMDPVLAIKQDLAWPLIAYLGYNKPSIVAVLEFPKICNVLTLPFSWSQVCKKGPPPTQCFLSQFWCPYSKKCDFKIISLGPREKWPKKAFLTPQKSHLGKASKKHCQRHNGPMG